MQRFTSLNVCGSVTYISWSIDFVWYLEDYLMDECCTGDIDSVWHKLTWNYICKSVTYISWSSDFAVYLEDCLMYKCHNWNVGSMWCKDLPHKCMWVSDLHFMVQLFCLISWRRFDGGMLYWRYWFSATLSWPTNIYVGQWSIFHGTVIMPYIFNTIWWTSRILWILVQCDLYFMI